MRRFFAVPCVLALLCAAPAMAQDVPDDPPDEAEDAAPASAAKADDVYVKLTFRSSPSAEVWHGKKLLGTSPVSINRRKDSGPVDVVFKAAGFLKMNSRAYSWSDDTVSVRLVPVEAASTVFGYKKPVAEDEMPDGGDDEEEP